MGELVPVGSSLQRSGAAPAHSELPINNALIKCLPARVCLGVNLLRWRCCCPVVEDGMWRLGLQPQIIMCFQHEVGRALLATVHYDGRPPSHRGGRVKVSLSYRSF